MVAQTLLIGTDPGAGGTDKADAVLHVFGVNVLLDAALVLGGILADGALPVLATVLHIDRGEDPLNF